MKPYAVIADGQPVAGSAGPASAELWRVPVASGLVVAAVGVSLVAAAALAIGGAMLAALAWLLVTVVAGYAVLPRQWATRTGLLALVAGVALVVLAPVHVPGTLGSVMNGLVLTVACIAAGLVGRATRTTLGSLAAARDAALVDRRNAKDRSREATARLLDLASSVDEVLWETDPSARLRYVSGSFERATGIAPDSVLGGNPAELAEKLMGRAGRFAACVARMRERREIRGVRLVWQDRTGLRRVWRVHGAPQLDDDGNFVRYRGIIVELRNGAALRRLRAIPSRHAGTPP